MKRYVIVSDLQVPYHNKRAVNSLCGFIADFQPDYLLNVGDDIDAPEPSRWNKGMAGEYAGTLQRNLEATYGVHLQFREALGEKPFHLMRSNHGDRVQTYVRRYAPALECLNALQIEELLGYDELGIVFHRQLFEFAPGWVLAHGDEGGLVQTAGGTALSLAKRISKSVICGHTHKAGLQHESRGFNGRVTTIYGMEVGHLMNLKKAHYLKTGAANWQTAFGVLYVDGRDVYPYVVPMRADGTFVFEGKVFRG